MAQQGDRYRPVNECWCSVSILFREEKGARIGSRPFLFLRMMVDTAYRATLGSHMHVTVSIGAAAADSHDNVASLLRKAQKCLYNSRTQGRNRVTTYGLHPEKADGI